MPRISFLLSISLHVLLFGFIAFWTPANKYPISLATYQVSLVIGSMGGEDLASPLLGKRPPKTNVAPLKAAENKKIPEEALPAKAIAKKAIAIPEKKIPLKKDKKQIPTKKKAPPKALAAKTKNPPTPKKSKVKKTDGQAMLKSALAEAERAVANKLPTSSALDALTELEKRVGAGGGIGDGDGGGAINNVYAALVMVAIQPNWSVATYSRKNLIVQVRIEIDKKGKILKSEIKKSSGRPDFDASAINAIIRTEYLPPPPTIQQQTIVISFNSLEMGAM